MDNLESGQLLKKNRREVKKITNRQRHVSF